MPKDQTPQDKSSSRRPSAQFTTALGALSAIGLALILVSSVTAEQVSESPSIVLLEGTEPSGTTDGPTGDLVHLARWIGDAPIVGLGEGMHGTHTLHRLTHRIFQHLVEYEGFEVFALEIDQAHAALLDEYVQGDLADLERHFAKGWWAQKIFYDEALKELLDWMRHYNETAERPLRFAGYDAKNPKLASQRLIRAVAGALEDEQAMRLDTLLSQALAPGAFGIYPNVWGFSGTFRIPIPKQKGGSKARIEVVVRGHGVDYGNVGFSAQAGAGYSSLTRWVPIETLLPTGTTHSIEVELPALAETLEISIFHRGNGTVSFEDPAVLIGNRRIDASGFEAFEVRPLMMPTLQRMDYRAEFPDGKTKARHTVRITADPLLDKSLEAARSASQLVDELLLRIDPEEFTKADHDWVRQLSRLMNQAVEWRTLAEPNRDVFLSENLLWLHRTAFPGRRILALGHASHTERRPGRMGAYVADALGDAYSTVSMVAGSGSYRAFGDVSQITENAPLELAEIDPEKLSELEAAIEKLHSGNFLVRFPEDPGAARTLISIEPGPSIPDAMVFVRRVEPLLRLPK